MIPQLKVLITGAGTVTCQSVIKGFRQQQEIHAHLTTVDPNPLSAGCYLSDSFYTAPLASDPGFVPALLEIVEREQIQLLIPIVDYEFPKFAESRTKFEALGCRVAISSPETIAVCNCKDETYRFFRENGIRTPTTWLPSELPQASQVPYPIFIKPRTGRASIGVHKISDAEEFAFWSKRVDDPLYQEFAVGDEYTIDVLSDFEGRVVGAVPRRRIEMKVGVSYKGITVCDPEMVGAARLIAEKAGIIGPCNIQCFRDKYGLNFFEINPRFSGSLPLTIAAGLNSPLLLAKLALGLEPRMHSGCFKENLAMLRYWEEIFVNSSDASSNQVSVESKTLRISKASDKREELDQISRDWSSKTGANGQLVAYTYRAVKPFFRGTTCLELGSADGQVTERILDDFEKIVAVDGSMRYIESLKGIGATNLEAVCALIEDFEIDERFDTVLMLHIIEHVDDPVTAIAIGARHMKDGGVLVIDVPNADSLHRLAGVKLGLLGRKDELNETDLRIGHRRVYTVDLMKKHIAEAGLHLKAWGGFFLKTVSNAQMEQSWTPEMMDAYFQLGFDFPHNAAEIYFVCTKAPGSTLDT